MRSSDGVTVFHGSGLSGGRALAEALEDLDGTGELPVTDELEQAFQETAETCNFQFLPAYADGTFSDPNAVLTWMYRTLSGGPAFTTEDADRWIDTWFAGAVWENGSTEDFPLSEDGSRYVPRSAYAGLWSYELRQLERREDGSVRLTLTVTRREYDRTGTRSAGSDAGSDGGGGTAVLSVRGVGGGIGAASATWSGSAAARRQAA